MDRITQAQRSANMSKIRSKDTKPEMLVRKLTYSMGFRYLLHPQGIPGKPDLVFKKIKKVIFVNGCFWHQHTGCNFAVMPKTNKDYWEKKLLGNVERDLKTIQMLEDQGWKVLVLWECQLNNIVTLSQQIKSFLIF